MQIEAAVVVVEPLVEEVRELPAWLAYQGGLPSMSESEEACRDRWGQRNTCVKRTALYLTYLAQYLNPWPF